MRATPLEALLFPPSGPLLVGLLGCLLYNRRPRSGSRLLLLAVLLLYGCSLPLVSQFGSALLQRDEPLTEAALTEFAPQAVVVLAGGLDSDAPEYGGETVNLRTLGRIRYAAELARRTGLPLLASGGYQHEAADDPPGMQRRSEAELMQRVLTEEFGLTQVMIEATSQTTWENALNSSAYLRHQGIGRIVLVTHAAHMTRAVYSFEQAGLQVLPAPTLYFPDEYWQLGWDSWLPSLDALYQFRYILHETLGLLWYRLH